MNLPQGFELVEDNSPALPAGFELLPDGFEEVKDGMYSQANSSMLDTAKGIGEAALSVFANTPAQIAAGLEGFNDAYLAGPIERMLGMDTERARDPAAYAARKVEERTQQNFGLGSYVPSTEKGKQYAEKAGELLNYPVEKAGQAGEFVGGNEGRFIAELLTGSAMELIDPTVAYTATRAAARARFKPEVGTTRSIAEDVIASEKQAAQPGMDPQLELPLQYNEQQIAEMQARSGNQMDLFSGENQMVGRSSELNNISRNEIPPPIDTMSQFELLDQPEMGRVANPYEARLGDWRVDENGIPIKADLTMDAMNVENPLQRNLWGDELENTRPPVGQGLQGVETSQAQGGIPLTQQIDALPDLPWKAERDTLTDNLRGAVDASGELQAAIQEANSSFQVPRSQRGAIDLKEVSEGLDKIRERFKKFAVEVENTANGVMVRLKTPDGQLSGFVDFSRRADGTLTAENAQVAKGLQGKGAAKRMYIAAREAGYDIAPGKVQTAQGKQMVDSMQKYGIINRDADGPRFDAGELNLAPLEGEKLPGSRYIPRSQRGAIDLGPGKESQTGANAEVVGRSQQLNSTATPRTPEAIAKKQELSKKLENLPFKVKQLEEFTDVATVQEAIELGKQAKDISADKTPLGVREHMAPGLNFMATFNNNPVLRFARKVLRDARTAAEAFSRKYITQDRVGMASIWPKLTPKERVQIMDALQAADKQQFQLTDSAMEKLGFNDKQHQFIKTYYEADKALLDKWNEKLVASGMKPVKERTGHFPGIFHGNYKSLVTDKAGKVIGVIAVDTKWQQQAAESYMQKAYPDAKIVTQERKGLEGNNVRSDIFSGMNDVMELLAKNDPRFADVQEVVGDAIKMANHQLFNFNVHELNKKGVIGNKGNEPWLKPEENAQKAFESMVRYFEEGALHHEMQIPVKELRELANSPELSHLPNTMKYLDRYLNHVTGQSLSPIGKAINIVLDTPFKLIGVGPSVPIKIGGQIKNRMSQIFMGWFNYMFTAAQLVQPLQTGLPFMSLVNTRLGGNLSTSKAFTNGANNFMLLNLEEMTGTKMDKVPDYQREAFQYAKDRGLLNFSEIERAYEGTKGKIGKAVDNIAEWNMMMGEKATRTPMFMSFVDLLHQGGLDTKTSLPIAEHLTQLSMIDYHAWERPMAYQKLGVIGQFAGGLTTFKHGYVGQQGILGKEAAKKGNAKPIALSVMAMIALGGITGMPFYDEMDEVFQYLSNKFFDTPMSIREAVLENLPEWTKTGALSSATGVAIQSKFSSADMVPDDIYRAASPHLNAFGKIVGDIIDVAKHGDDQSVRNLIINATPSQWKGWSEYTFSRDQKGRLLDKEGLPSVDRTEQDWQVRKWTGLRPLNEAVEMDKAFDTQSKRKADQEAKTKIAENVRRGIVNNTLTREDLQKAQQEYLARKGDPRRLLEVIIQATKDKELLQKQRQEGVPGQSLESVFRYQYYNNESDY